MGFTQDPMERASPPSLPPSKEKYKIEITKQAMMIVTWISLKIFEFLL
jgi:hypothetical protein